MSIPTLAKRVEVALVPALLPYLPTKGMHRHRFWLTGGAVVGGVDEGGAKCNCGIFYGWQGREIGLYDLSGQQPIDLVTGEVLV